MSNAHKGSKLELKDQLIAVDFSTAHFDYSKDATGIRYGNLIEPVGGTYTVRPNGGMFGSCLAVEESTTNLVGARWNNSNTTMTDDASIKIYNDETAWKIERTITGGTAYAGWKYDTVSGNTYTASLYMYDPYDHWNNTHMYDDTSLASASPALGGFIDLGGGYKRIELTHTATQTNTTSHGLITYTKTTLGSKLWVSAPQIENKTFATSHTVGTRSANPLSYSADIVNPSEGTVSFWVKPNYPLSLVTTQPTSNYLLRVGNYYGNGSFTIWNYVSANRISLYIKGETSTGWTGTLSLTDSLIEREWQMITVTWDASNIFKIYHNGKIKAQVTSTEKLGKVSGNNFLVGDKYSTLYNDMFFARKPLSDEDIESIYISQKPLYNPYDYRASS